MSVNPAAEAQGTFLGISKLSIFFGVLMLTMTSYFIYWGLDYTNYNFIAMFILASLFGVFMAFTIGGNDVANSFGTSVGAGTLTIKQALVIAAIFEVSGAMIAGGEVTKTIRGGIVDLSKMSVDPMDFVYIMMAALLASALWLLYATKKGYPVSTTHSIIGGIVGSSMTLGILLSGFDASLNMVKWDKIGQIAISWVLSPVLGGLVAYVLYSQIKKHILVYNESASEQEKVVKKEKRELKQKHKTAFERMSEIQQVSYTYAMTRDIHVTGDRDFDPDDLETDYFKDMRKIEKKRDEINSTRALETWVPMIAALGAMVMSAMLLFKGLQNLNLGLTTLHNFFIMSMVGASAWMAVFIFAKTLKGHSLDRSTFMLFSWMQVFTAAGFAFSHGSNDIANAIGPFAAILDVLHSGEINAKAAVPPIAMFTFGIALIAGLWFIGKEVIATVGTNLTKMHPASGFSAELAAASVVMLASMLGLPVSSTHILIGAVLGIGLVNKANNWDLMKPIALAWVITLPAAAILSAIAFLILRSIF